MRQVISVIALVVGAVTLFGAPSTAADEVNLSRFILEAAPSFESIEPIDQSVVEAFCRDKDGCEVILQRVEFDAGKPGSVASRTLRLFLSATSNWWRLSDDTEGNDGDGVLGEFQFQSCYFTDAEKTVPNPSPPFIPIRKDEDPGFALANPSGANCRIVLID